MAVYADLYVDQGSTFASVVFITDANERPLDISTYTVRGQLRKSYSSTTGVKFATSKINTTGGEAEISLTAEQTSSLKAGRYVYDVEIISSSGAVTRVVEGQLTITPRVTQPSDYS